VGDFTGKGGMHGVQAIGRDRTRMLNYLPL
jgi:hypothetical protein